MSFFMSQVGSTVVSNTGAKVLVVQIAKIISNSFSNKSKKALS